jgi:hypothetical protein
LGVEFYCILKYTGLKFRVGYHIPLWPKIFICCLAIESNSREGVGAGGEMTQALYAHMNNKRKKKNISILRHPYYKEEKCG